MYLQPFLYQVATIVIPAIIILFFAYYLFNRSFNEYLNLRFNAANSSGNDPLLSYRLQAHERMIVFIERINPSNLLIRLHQQGIGVLELQTLVIAEINSEFQHNITQQLYIEEETWNVIRKLKDDTIAMIGNGVKGLDPDATGVDLSRKVLQHMSTMKENPYDLTLSLIKQGIAQKL
jgi:hypothetical protein